MNTDMEFAQDERTVLANPQGQRPQQEALTDFAKPPRFEELEARMVYSATHAPGAIFNMSINPLVSAAAPLFSALLQLKVHGSALDQPTLKHLLQQHLLHFEGQAIHDGVDNGQVMTARYVLCTVADETVVTSEWGPSANWSSSSLLSTLHHETFGGEKFFALIEVMGRDPIHHLPMLELMYICLSLGFEGKYHLDSRGPAELEAIRDRLHRQIRYVRGDVPRELSPHWQGLHAPQRGLVRIVPWWLVAAFSAICLAVMYSGFAHVLAEKRESVLSLYQPTDPVVLAPTL